jgi:hypothetical protein
MNVYEEWLYFNSVVDDSERQFHVAAALHTGKKPLAPTVQKDGWAPDPFWKLPEV